MRQSSSLGQVVTALAALRRGADSLGDLLSQESWQHSLSSNRYAAFCLPSVLQKRFKSKKPMNPLLVSIHIKQERQKALQDFWRDERGVQNLAMLARFRHFAGIYPRYRDLGYLRHQLIAWDAAIRRLFNHEQGKIPANNLARRHPFVLSKRIAPKTWSRDALQGRLPHYDWQAVLQDMQQDADALTSEPAKDASPETGQQARKPSLASWGF